MRISTVFLCVVLLAGASLISLAPQSVAAPGPRSVQSAKKASLLVTNQTGKKVEIFWVDFKGNQQSYGKLKPGAAPVNLDTFAGHVWVFVSQGVVLQTYTAVGGQQQVALGGAGGAGAAQNFPPKVVNLPPGGPVQPKPVVVVPPVNPGGGRAPAEATDFLKVHNDARAKVGAPPLQWSDALARYAQKWADQLAAAGTFQHRDNSATGYGENIFGGSNGFMPGDAARAWLEERAAYKGGPVTPANFSTVAHYTQMVWSTSTEVGYGFARGRNGVIVVANYSPRGNMSGQKPY